MADPPQAGADVQRVRGAQGARARIYSFLARIATGTGPFVLLLQLALWMPRNVHDTGPYDLDVYHAAARHAAAGEQVYGRQARVETSTVPLDFFYPPTALALIRPAAGLQLTTFRYVGFTIAIVAMWGLAAALVTLATGALDARKTLAVGTLLALFAPVTQNLNTGNADMLVIAMTAWAFAAPRAAAVLLVLAASIKVYPAFALVAWLPREDARFRARAAITAAIVLAWTFAVVHAGYVREWITLGLPSLSAPSTHYGNWSLSTILVFPGLRNDISDVPQFVRVVLSIAPFAASVVAALCCRKQPVRVAAVAALVAGTWFTSFCWWWRILVLLTIPAAVWIAHAGPKTSPPTAPGG